MLSDESKNESMNIKLQEHTRKLYMCKIIILLFCDATTGFDSTSETNLMSIITVSLILINEKIK